MLKLEKLFNAMIYLFKNAELADLIDIALVTVLIYYFIKFIRGRRAGKLAIGVGCVIVLLFVSDLFDMPAMNFLFSNIVQVGVLAILVLFQPEIRTALEQIGGNSVKTLKNTVSHKEKVYSHNEAISNICQAVTELSRDYTGALIIIERSTLLGDILDKPKTTIVNADISVSILKNIFFNKAPLHDGAVIIRDNRVYAAGCVLPMTERNDILKDLGTRHRAAIAMSENSDAIAIVVSEETGTISIALNGELRRNYDYNTLKQELTDLLSGDR